MTDSLLPVPSKPSYWMVAVPAPSSRSGEMGWAEPSTARGVVREVDLPTCGVGPLAFASVAEKTAPCESARNAVRASARLDRQGLVIRYILSSRAARLGRDVRRCAVFRFGRRIS